MREGSKLSFPGAGNGRFHVSETRASGCRKRELPTPGIKVKPHRGFRYLHLLRPRLMDKGSDSGVLPSKRLYCCHSSV